MAFNVDQRRRLNDHRRRLFEDTAGEIAFLCECADESCTRSVLLSPARFDELRGSGTILLHPGHDALRVEAVPPPVEALLVEPLQPEILQPEPPKPEPLQ